MPLPEPIIFDQNQTNLIEPASSVIDDGFADGDRPPAAWVNWLFNRSGQWAEFIRLLYQSRVLNWRPLFDPEGANFTRTFIGYYDAKLLSNGQEVVVCLDQAASLIDVGDEELRLLVLDRGEYSLSNQALSTGIPILPSHAGGRNYRPWIADDGIRAGMIAPNPGGTEVSLLHTALPITTASAWGSAVIDGSSTRQILSVHYSTQHSLWIVVTTDGANFRIYTSATANGTWTNRQTLGGAPTGAFIAESAAGVLVAQIKKTTNTHEYWRSTNGITWSAVTDFGIAGVSQELFYDAHNNLFWSHQGTNLYYSSDGTTGSWTQATAFVGTGVGAGITSMACDQYGTIVGLGASVNITGLAAIQFSVDAGASWNEMLLPGLNTAIGTFPVSFTGERFIAGLLLDDDDAGVVRNYLVASNAILDAQGIGTSGAGLPGAGAPINADYVVGTANSTLSGELVADAGDFKFGSGAFKLAPLTEKYQREDDMENPDQDGRWIKTTNAGTASAVAQSWAGHPGTIRYSATSSTAKAGFGTTGAIYQIGNGTTWKLRIIFRITQLSDGTNTFWWRFGLFSSSIATPVSGVGIEYRHDVNGGEFQLVAYAASTPTATDTNVVVVAGDKYVVELECDGTTLTGSINGVSVGSVASGLPASSVDLGLHGYLLKSAGGGAVTWDCDAVKQDGIFTTPR